MAEIRDADAPMGRFAVVGTLIGVVAIVGLAYKCDRAYRRWLRENHPLAGHRARLDRMRTGYQTRSDNVIEVAQLISEVFVEVARATSKGSTP